MPGAQARYQYPAEAEPVRPGTPQRRARDPKAIKPEPEPAPKREKRRGSFLIKLAVFCVGVILLLSVVERQVQIAEKKEQLSQLQTQLNAQNVVNDELQATLSDQQSLEEYAEKRARRDLDYAKPNERVYIDMGGE